MIKRHFTLCLVLGTLGTGTILAQTLPVSPPPAAIPAPPAPPVPPQPDGNQRHRPGELTTFLGVGVEPIPTWLGDQLNLPTGFGLVVNFVAPGSPAEVAGVKVHDILKQYNDQMLANPEQLTALVQSGKVDQDASLTVLHKGQEAKLIAKLQARSGSQWEMGSRRESEGEQRGPRRGRAEDLDGEGLYGNGIPAAVRDITRDEVLDIERNARRAAAEQMRKGQEMIILRDKNGKSTSTKLDLSQSRIILKDAEGEVEINGEGTEAGHLFAKDPQKKTVYDGPVKDAPASLLKRVRWFGGGKLLVEGNRVAIKPGADFAFENQEEDEEAKLVIKDDQGEVEITGMNSEAGHLLARDPQGKKIYDGDVVAAPAPLKRRVRRFEGGKVIMEGNIVSIKPGKSFPSKDEVHDEDAKAAPPTAPAPSIPPIPPASSPGV